MAERQHQQQQQQQQQQPLAGLASKRASEGAPVDEPLARKPRLLISYRASLYAKYLVAQCNDALAEARDSVVLPRIDPAEDFEDTYRAFVDAVQDVDEACEQLTGAFADVVLALEDADERCEDGDDDHEGFRDEEEEEGGGGGRSHEALCTARETLMMLRLTVVRGACAVPSGNTMHNLLKQLVDVRAIVDEVEDMLCRA